MKRKNTTGQFIIALIMIAALFVAAIVMFAWSAYSDKPPEGSQSSEAPSEIIQPKPTEEPPEEKENTPGDFKLLESAEPTLQGKSGYFTQKINGELVWEWDKAFVDEWCNEETAVEGIKTFLGNQVYRVPESALTRCDPRDGEGTVCVQLYGYSPNVVDEDGYVLNTAIWLREEYTGKRIYPFNTIDELDAAQARWEKGQDILSGKQVEDGAVIVNGQYLDSYPFEVRDGEYYLPLRQIAKLVNKDIYYDNTDAGLIVVPLQGNYAGNTVTVPYSNKGGNTFIAGGVDDLGEMEEGHWNDTFQTGIGPNCYVPASELSRYTGWYIYTDGHAIHVVSDETDVSDHFVLVKQGNRSVEAQLQHGDTVIKYLDPSEITLFEEEMNTAEAGGEESGTP